MSFSRTVSASITGLVLALAGVGAAAGAAQATARPATVHPAAVSPAVVSHGFTAVAQTRLLDTRTDPAIHKFGPGGTADLTVTGLAGVPSTGVSAVVLNVTAIARTASTYITVYPAGAGKPNSSNLNVLSGFIRANQVIAQVGTNGQITIYNYNGNTDVLVDITGYLATGSSYTGETPARILDTRATKTPLAARTTRVVQVTGHGGVPTGVTSVVVNMTGLSTTQGGYLTAYPTGTTRPVTSNLNLTASQTSAVLVIAKLSSTGSLTLYSNGGPTNVLLDVQGWFTGTADYTSLNPVRILDSRVTTSAAPYGVDYEMQVSGKGGVPASAGAVALSVTSVDPSSTGTITVHPGGTKVPGTSSINAPSGRATPNLVIVQLSSTGTISIYNHAPGAILVDVEGWFATNPALTPPNAGVIPGVVGQSYDYTIAAPGGLAPLTWSVVSGTLPDGLALNSSNGAVTGTPTTAGPVTVKIAIADSSNETAQQSVTFTVYSVPSKQVWGWGATGSGVLGSTATGNASTSAIPVSGITGYTQVATGGSTAYGLKGDGTVEAWGKGTNGQLGDGSTTPSTTTPVQVSGLSNVTQIASGGAGGTGYALESDGTVWAWGKGQSGQLGNGTTTAVATTPVQVHTVSNVTAIGTGPTTTYAVEGDGTVWAWGSGGGGQIGNGLKVSETSPVKVNTLTRGGRGRRRLPGRLRPEGRRHGLGLGHRQRRAARERHAGHGDRAGPGAQPDRHHADRGRVRRRLRAPRRWHGRGVGCRPGRGARQRWPEQRQHPGHGERPEQCHAAGRRQRRGLRPGQQRQGLVVGPEHLVQPGPRLVRAPDHVRPGDAGPGAGAEADVDRGQPQRQHRPGRRPELTDGARRRAL